MNSDGSFGSGNSVDNDDSFCIEDGSSNDNSLMSGNGSREIDLVLESAVDLVTPRISVNSNAAQAICPLC
jgi:hypothetical protein